VPFIAVTARGSPPKPGARCCSARVFDRSFDRSLFDAHEGPVLCCIAVQLSIDCQTVATQEASGGKLLAVWITQSTCSCSCMRNSWQSRPRHSQQCNPHNQLMPCMWSVRSTQSASFMVLHWTRAQWQGMSAGIWSLRQAAVMRARILTWAAAPTALQKHCQRGRPHHFVAGMRRCNCLDCHEFSSTPLRFRPHPRMQMQLSFCPHPRMQLQLHATCELHTASSFPPLTSCAATV
jgi:hypothetical protein